MAAVDPLLRCVNRTETVLSASGQAPEGMSRPHEDGKRLLTLRQSSVSSTVPMLRLSCRAVARCRTQRFTAAAHVNPLS